VRVGATRTSSLSAWLVGRTLRERESRLGTLLVSPTFLIVMVVVVFPFAWTILLSLQRVRLIDLQRLGLTNVELTLDNFELVFNAPFFVETLRVTMIFSVLGTLAALAFGLVAALALQSAFRGRAIVRGLVLIPYVAPVVASAIVWKALLNPQFGFVNAIGTRWLGWDAPIAFLSEQSYPVTVAGIDFGVPLALLVVVLFEGWKTFPFAYLFILARLQAMPEELDDAARMDGASPTQRFFHVTLPQLKGVIALLIFIRFIWTFQSFNEIYLLTGGSGGTEVLSIHVFNFLVFQNNVGAASALGLVMALILAGVLFVYYRVTGEVHRIA
jgi:multiple sugar transport system permease protein